MDCLRVLFAIDCLLLYEAATRGPFDLYGRAIDPALDVSAERKLRTNTEKVSGGREGQEQTELTQTL